MSAPSGLRIAHLSAEVSPFAKTGGLGDVVGALPKAQARLGNDVTVWMPLYRQVWETLARRNDPPAWVCDPFQVVVGLRRFQVGLLRTRLPGSDVPVYLVGSDPHFDRAAIYDPEPSGLDDGIVRYTLLVRAALEGMRRLGFAPDVLHAHDWHTTMAPMALAWDRPRDLHFERTLTVLTVHNMAYQGIYPRSAYVHLGLSPYAYGQVEWDDHVNLMKGGVVAAHVVTAVSPSFAHEITTPEGGFRLDPVLRSRRDALYGIVNGIDRDVWDPATDRRIPVRYDASSPQGKHANRRILLEQAGMDPDDPGFVVGLVSRLTHQKGIDLLFPALGDLLASGVRIVLLGSGDDDLERAVRDISHRAAGRFWGYVGFQDDLAHLIEAGADAFLMPSRFEPCGLSQLYSLAYGSPPIVRRVGGLTDTVIPFDGGNSDVATGFAFHAPHAVALRECVLWAQSCYHDSLLWTRIVRNGMAQDYAWERSAEKYLALYRHARAQRGLS
ncbi:MAG: glycogen synthase [Acidobacteriota bacterium]